MVETWYGIKVPKYFYVVSNVWYLFWYAATIIATLMFGDILEFEPGMVSVWGVMYFLMYALTIFALVCSNINVMTIEIVVIYIINILIRYCVTGYYSFYTFNSVEPLACTALVWNGTHLFLLVLCGLICIPWNINRLDEKVRS